MRPWGCWGSVSEGSSGLMSIRIRTLRPLPIAAAHGVGARRKAFYVVFVCARWHWWHNDARLADQTLGCQQ